MKNSMDALKAQKNPLIIYGAYSVGEIVHQVCASMGLEIACFCDDRLTGAFSGLNIHSLKELRTLYPDASFIVTVSNIDKVVKKITEAGYTTWFDLSAIFSSTFNDAIRCRYEGFRDLIYTDHTLKMTMWTQKNYDVKGKLYARSLDLIVTERCTLKCRDCSNLIQYFKKPIDVDTEKVFESIDLVAKYFDGVCEIRLIGGEALLHKDITKIMNKVMEIDKFQYAVVYTNGTILPNAEKIEVLQHPKAFLSITNYGDKSRKLQQLVSICDENDIAYGVLEAGGWVSCSSIEEHHRTVQENKELFKECCMTAAPPISDGRLYRCPYSAGAARLQAIPDNPLDYIDLYEMDADPREMDQKKNKINSFLYRRSYFPACDFCTGRAYDKPVIPPAIQTKSPLPYTKYQTT